MKIEAKMVQRWLNAYNQAIAAGMSLYYTDDTQGTLDSVYHNLWVLRFTDVGQCRSFTEWYMQAPGTP